ncbi:MAG: hypothetical protein ACRCU3_07850 [Eubacteriaceae bacterium]
MDLKPYSYHTFIFPFNWDNDGTIKNNEFEKIFESKMSPWKKLEWKIPCEGEEKNFWNNLEIETFEDARINYANYQYFHEPVRDAIYGTFHEQNKDEAVVVNYTYDPEVIRNRSYYYIEKDNNIFRLKLNGIKLKLFNTGVAVICFEAENFDYRSIEAVKLINDFGRRILAPIIPDSSGLSLCADVLGVEIMGKPPMKTDFRKFFRAKANSKEGVKEHVLLNYIASFIKDLLVEGTEYTITSRKECDGKNDKNYYICPIIDDRMFVCCLVRDDAFMKKLKEEPEKSKNYEIIKNTSESEIGLLTKSLEHLIKGISEELKVFREERKDSRYAYLRIPEVADELYSFAFVDAKDSTCQNDEMTQKLFEKHIYSRWIKYGTIHAVTHHSFMCVTGEAEFLFPAVINPYLTMYVQMSILTLIQRASIIVFDRKSTKITRGIEAKKSFDSKKVTEFKNLQERYVAFQNQLLFFEVTAQEQGIELYEMLTESLYIKKEKEHLDHELKNLYEVSNVNQDINFNKWARIFAIAALILAIFPLFQNPSCKLGIISLVVTMVVIIFIYYKFDK